MKPITLAYLKSLDACQEQVDLFAQTYGESVTPTPAVCEAVAQLFDFNWLGKEVFGEAYREALAPHERAYREAVATLWKAYQEAKAPHWKAYEEARAPHWKAYEEARALHLKAYEEATAPHWKAYQEARAPLNQALKLAQARTFYLLWSQ